MNLLHLKSVFLLIAAMAALAPLPGTARPSCPHN